MDDIIKIRNASKKQTSVERFNITAFVRKFAPGWNISYRLITTTGLLIDAERMYVSICRYVIEYYDGGSGAVDEKRKFPLLA